MSILIVDDDKDIIRGLERFLVERKYDVQAVDCAQKALDCITENPPEVIVSDIRMAGMDGIELLKVVRTRYPSIPFILMTGHGDTNAITALQYGAFDYLKKPIRLVQLLDCIERALNRRKLEDQFQKDSFNLLRAGKSEEGLWPVRDVEEFHFLVEAIAENRDEVGRLWDTSKLGIENGLDAVKVFKKMMHLLEDACSNLQRIDSVLCDVKDEREPVPATIGMQNLKRPGSRP